MIYLFNILTLNIYLGLNIYLHKLVNSIFYIGVNLLQFSKTPTRPLDVVLRLVISNYESITILMLLILFYVALCKSALGIRLDGAW